MISYSNDETSKKVSYETPVFDMNAANIYAAYGKIDVLPPIVQHTNLRILSCQFNKLRELPEMSKSLVKLNIMHNKLYVLPDLTQFVNLTLLRCDHAFDDSITIMPRLPDGIITLNCSYNQLQQFTNLPQSLVQLYCGYNNLIEFPDELPPRLELIDCKLNQLRHLPQLPENLIWMDCSHNQLFYLPQLPDTIRTLNCSHNQLMYFPKLSDNLITLDCSNNSILMLPNVLPANLSNLRVNKNNIAYLPYPLPDTLSRIMCNNNPLPKILIDPLYNGIELTPNVLRAVYVMNHVKELIYTFKFYNQFRDWLWQKVRLPHIEAHYHPSKLIERLNNMKNENDEAEFDELMESW